MSKEFSKLPRLYMDQSLSQGSPITLDSGPAHYFRTVLRRQAGDAFRVFNGHDGEFLARITRLGKKDGEAFLDKKLREQPPPPPQIHLLFAPIKKQRMDFLIEKAVELGATALHPVLTARCEVRKINEERIRAQIIEAAEQCERMDIPAIHELCALDKKLTSGDLQTPVFWCFERSDSPLLSVQASENCTFLIGPEGGFAEQEIEMLLKMPAIRPVSLGPATYRAETAALLCLAHVRLQTESCDKTNDPCN